MCITVKQAIHQQQLPESHIVATCREFDTVASAMEMLALIPTSEQVR